MLYIDAQNGFNVLSRILSDNLKLVNRYQADFVCFSQIAKYFVQSNRRFLLSPISKFQFGFPLSLFHAFFLQKNYNLIIMQISQCFCIDSPTLFHIICQRKSVDLLFSYWKLNYRFTIFLYPLPTKSFAVKSV